MEFDKMMRVAALFVLLVITSPADAGPATAEESIRARLSVTTEILHGQGYWSPGLRVGQDGGWGVRYARMSRPTWAREIPQNLNLGSKWQIESAGLLEVDREFCGERWCGGIGVAHINRVTPMNGTLWNFGLHVRYAIDKDWSIVLDHYSHGSALGIAQDKSNRGWNLLGVSYGF